MKTDNDNYLCTPAFAEQIKARGTELGFQAVGIGDIDLHHAEQDLQDWLALGYHGEMAYMQQHGVKRSRPELLIPGTLRVISARIDYLPEITERCLALLDKPGTAYISRYALGRDYHKVIRKRLQKLAQYIAEQAGPYGYRVFTDSAPVLEKPLAQKAGLGWIGKHTNLIAQHSGSWFFLGEIYVDIPLAVDEPETDHCGSCQACLDVCPTSAIVAPYKLDARRCISYLTIELRGHIPLDLRPLIGNRIYGCDDCQLCCPWNRFATLTQELDFQPRHNLDKAGLLDLFNWSETDFLRYTEGSAIRRIGYESWLRNLAVALGNQLTSGDILAALLQQRNHPSPVIREHVRWALNRHNSTSYSS